MRRWLLAFAMSVGVAMLLLCAACSDSSKAQPPSSEVTLEPGVYKVEHAELFPLTKVESRQLPTVVQANGTVTPDVNRTIHVTSQGAGRVVDLRAKLGDYVKKGQILLSIHSADLVGAFSEYQKAQADERLSHKALDRQQLLFSHGAAAQKDLELAEDAEEKAKVDVSNTEQHIRVLGGDPANASTQIDLRAPVAGTIVEQNVAGFEGVKSLDNSPSLFTIADLSQVWVVCDVFENDLGKIAAGDHAEVRLNAFPDRELHGQISDVARVLDPATRSAKVRVVLANPDGALRPGMYTVAKFRTRKSQPHIVVPTSAVMRLQDRDWIFRKEADGKFRKVQVMTIAATEDGMQEIQEGAVQAGQEIVTKALEFSTAMAEQGK